MHVGGGVDRRAVYHEEQAALREALELGTATTHAERMLPIVEVTVPAASIVVMHVDAPNYRPPSTTVSKKECDERKHAKAMREWQSGAHQLGGAAGVAGGAAMGLEDESSDGGGGVATVLPGRRRSALSGSLWQQAAAEGAAAAAGTPPVRMASSHGLALSDSLRFLRGQLREFLRECATAGVEVTMYDAGEGVLYPTEQWTVHFFKWLRARV